MSMVLEMPAMADSPPRQPFPPKLQARLVKEYDDILPTITQAYTIPDKQAVFAFLQQHSELIPVLIEGRAVVSFFFSEETSVALTLLRDVDVGLDYLVAWIKVPLPSSEASDRLFDLSDTWLRTRAAVIGERLSFNLGAL
jgi:hypothetical protein